MWQPFWVQSGGCGRFLPSVEMMGLAGNKGQKGENGSDIFSFLFFHSQWRRHVERSETSVGDREEVFSILLASSSAAAGKESAENPFFCRYGAGESKISSIFAFRKLIKTTHGKNKSTRHRDCCSFIQQR